MTKIFFSPFADIWEYSIPENQIIKALLSKDKNILMVRCRGALSPLCIPGQINGFNLETPIQERNDLCKRCIGRAQKLDRSANVNSVYLDDYVSKNDYARIEELIKSTIESRTTFRDPDDFQRITLNGYQIGRVALYELILRYKLHKLDLTDQIWSEYLSYLRMASVVYFSVKSLFKGLEPTMGCCFNSLYVANRVFSDAIRNKGVPQYFMHSGTNLSKQNETLMIGRGYTWGYLKRLADRFKIYSRIPIAKEVVEGITRHFKSLFEAKNLSVFSEAKSNQYTNIKEYFGINKRNKIIVACTSSYDERFAVEATGMSSPPKDILFKNIQEWITFLANFAEKNKNCTVIIRVHPREYPNRRDAIKSEHSKELAELFSGKLGNLKFNWPDQKISIYDLIQEADLVLNAWSSVGKEIALLGLPVISYCSENLLYPSELNVVPKGIEEYEKSIIQNLDASWNFERVRLAYRWYGMEFARSMIPIHDGFLRVGNFNSKFLRFVDEKINRIVFDYKFRMRLIATKRCEEGESLAQAIFLGEMHSGEEAQDQARYNCSEEREEEEIRSSLKTIGDILFEHNPPMHPTRLQTLFEENNLHLRAEYAK